MSNHKYLYRIEHEELGIGIFRFFEKISEKVNEIYGNGGADEEKLKIKSQFRHAHFVKTSLDTNHPCIEDDIIEDFSGFKDVIKSDTESQYWNTKCILNSDMRFESHHFYGDVDQHAIDYMLEKYKDEGGLCAIWDLSKLESWIGEELFSMNGLWGMNKAGLVLKRIKMKPEAEVLYTNTQAVFFKSEVEEEKIYDIGFLYKLMNKWSDL